MLNQYVEFLFETATMGERGEDGDPEGKEKRGRKTGSSVPRWSSEEEDKLKAAVEELMTLHEHPAPKPLVWMSQMIVDESGELRSKHDRPH